jgi:hypothetical protein
MGIQNWTPGVKHANYGLTRDDHKFVGLWSNLTSSSRLCFGLQMASSLFSLLSCKESPQLQELHDKKSKDRRKIAILVSSRALYGSTALVAGDKIRSAEPISQVPQTAGGGSLVTASVVGLGLATQLSPTLSFEGVFIQPSHFKVVQELFG